MELSNVITQHREGISLDLGLSLILFLCKHLKRIGQLKGKRASRFTSSLTSSSGLIDQDFKELSKADCNNQEQSKSKS
jgi:hypothetical protein